LHFARTVITSQLRDPLLGVALAVAIQITLHVLKVRHPPLGINTLTAIALCDAEIAVAMLLNPSRESWHSARQSIQCGWGIAIDRQPRNTNGMN
jgi:urea transporter